MCETAAFFDWDGTLSADGTTVSPAAAQAIRAFRQKGNRAFLCTGRASGYIPCAARELGFDGEVAAAGAFVRLGGRQLYRRFIPQEEVLRLIAHFLADGQSCTLEGEQGMYLVGQGGHVPVGWRPIVSAEEFARRYPGHVISKLTLRGAMSQATQALLAPAYTVIRHETYEEVLPAGCSKSDGMRRLLEAAGISRDNCWAFGDSCNDVDMLRYAGIGVAMGGAPDEVKAAADRVTKPASQDGVAYMLERLMAENA